MVLKLKNKWGVIAILVLWLLVVSVILVLTVSQRASGVQRLLPVYSVDTQGKKLAALTFNAAWDNETTDEILEILREKKVSASFFFVGDFAKKYPEAVRKIHNSGHETGNHSMRHILPTKQSYDALCRDIAECNKLLEELTGKSPVLYRAPSGDYDNSTVTAAISLGMTAVQWDCDSIDWKDKSPEEIHRRIMKNISPGSIMLFHLGKENTLKALPGIIDEIKAQGYELVTVSEMLLTGDTYTDVQGKQRRGSGGA